jgi:hypothetical protein
MENQITLTLDYAMARIVEIEGAENQARKRDCYKSYQIREGLLHKYVKERIIQMYPITGQFYSIADYSILKKVVEKKAKAYKEAPSRKLNGGDADTEEYQTLVKECGLNTQLKEIDKLYNEHKYCALAVFPYIEDSLDEVSERKVSYRFIPLAPYEYDLIKNKHGDTEVVVLSYPSLDITRGISDGINEIIAESGNSDEGNIRSYVFWTEFEHKLYKAKGSGDELTIWEELLEGNPDGINPYGVLTIVDMPQSYDSNYPLPNPLPHQTVELNALLSIYLQSGSMQVGQLVLKYPQGQELETISQGVFSGIKLPQSKNPDDSETTADYINPSPNMSAHKESIYTYASMILDEQGINSSQVAHQGNEKYTSGLDRLLASADIQSLIEDNQEKYLELEHEIFEIVKQCNLVLGGYVYSSDEVGITFLKPKMLISDSEKLDNLKKKRDLGIFEDWELLVDYNPNLSEEDAKSRIDDLKAKKLISMVANVTPKAIVPPNPISTDNQMGMNGNNQKGN